MRKRKVRSALTIISVLIGIAAITTLISFGYGISSYVEEFSRQMGNDKLMVQPRGMGLGHVLNSNIRLDESDLKTIRGVDGVAEATGVYMLSGEIESRNQKKYGYIFGMDFSEYGELIDEIYSLEIVEGETLRNDELSKVALGFNYLRKNKIFDNALKTRDKVVINRKEFKIKGFYEEVGNPQDDSNIYITKEAAESLFGTDNYQFILIRASAGRDPTKLVATVREELRDHRNQGRGNEDFFVQTFEQVIATFTAVLGVITAVVILIALISMVVASVNIMNTMYASILERTKEIGVFKAIGSRNREILFIFVFESTVLSLIGGLAGILVGYLISSFAGNIIVAAGYAIFSPVFTWQLVVGSLLFALFVGIGSGILPAYRASKLKPIEALRYE